MGSAATVSVNGRCYHAPDRPVVVVCIDGSEPEYFERGLAAGATPALARFQREGVYRLARSVVPSFTNPNNLSIVTGAPPAVHGDRKSTRLNSSHRRLSRMPSSA